jgi:hypothetical protein
VSREFGTGASGAGSVAVDLDRLADFTAGVLDRADAAEVAHLVASDARWATAHAALVRADPLVRDELRAAWAASPMPADVAARIDDSLRAIGATSGAKSRDRTRAANPAVVSLDAARARGTGRPGGTARAGAAGRGRWRGSWTGLAAAAAAVVAVIGGIAVANQFATQGAPTTASGSGSGREESADQAPAPGAASAPTAAFAGTPSFVISGIDYRPETLAQLARMQLFGGVKPSDTGSKVAGGGEVPQMVRDAAAEPLSRLTDPVALRTCLNAIGSAHPGSVTLVDYARFGGEPALVVVVRRGTASTVVAVGPDCGLAGADEKASAPVS